MFTVFTIDDITVNPKQVVMSDNHEACTGTGQTLANQTSGEEKLEEGQSLTLGDVNQNKYFKTYFYPFREILQNVTTFYIKKKCYLTVLL